MPLSTVHIVDDDEGSRTSTARLLMAAGYHAHPHASAVAFLAAVRPDMRGCIILDVRLPGQSGLDVQVSLAELGVELPIIFLTGYAEIPDTVRAIQRGAVDFLTKPVDGRKLLDAVTRALEQDAAASAARTQLGALRARFERLTPREREVLLHLIGGQINKQVAADLQITERTIKQHRARIFEKLEVDSMAAMTRLAVQLGLDPDQVSARPKDR
jgi:FixJ family two-component response regulator